MSTEFRVNRLPPASHARIKALHKGVVHYEPQACSRCEETGFHIMLDIETLGLKPGAPVLTIGAVSFCPHTGGILDTLYLAIDPDLACEAADFVDPDTEAWWAEQPDAAREQAFAGTMRPHEAALRLLDFISGYENVKVWGNGATFDISILEHWLQSIAGEGSVPWKFWNIRDVRTVKGLFPDVVNRDDFDLSSMVAHHALDDALFQVRYTSAGVIAGDAVNLLCDLLFRMDQESVVQEFDREEAVALAHLDMRRIGVTLWQERQDKARIERERDKLKALVEQARNEYLERHSDGIHDCVTPYDHYR